MGQCSLKESEDYMFCKDRNVLFHLILNRQLCKIFSFIFLFQKSNWEGTLTGIRFYTVGDLEFDETIPHCFYETRDPDSL